MELDRSEESRRQRLFRLRHEAHLYFDPIWLYKYEHSGKTVQYWRRRAYSSLAGKLGIPKDQCHISRFTEDQCIKVIDICAEQYEKNPRLMGFVEKLDSNHRLTWFMASYNKSKSKSI